MKLSLCLVSAVLASSVSAFACTTGFEYCFYRLPAQNQDQARLAIKNLNDQNKRQNANCNIESSEDYLWKCEGFFTRNVRMIKKRPSDNYICVSRSFRDDEWKKQQEVSSQGGKQEWEDGEKGTDGWYSTLMTITNYD